jgi:hypothetical protein
MLCGILMYFGGNQPVKFYIQIGCTANLRVSRVPEGWDLLVTCPRKPCNRTRGSGLTRHGSPDLTLPTGTPRFEEFVSHMKKVTEEAKAALTKAADDMAQFYDMHCQEPPSLAVGDKVWPDATNIAPRKTLMISGWVLIPLSKLSCTMPINSNYCHPLEEFTLYSMSVTTPNYPVRSRPLLHH